MDYSSLKQQLMERKKTVESRIKNSFSDEERDTLSFTTGELSQYDNHPADTATDLYEREKDAALMEQLEHEHEEIEHALAKFDNGTYGICERTGKEIPFERLEANPTARTIIMEESSNHWDTSHPAEEDVLEGFDTFVFDHISKETQFDAEDSYQAVASFNENSMIFEDSSLTEQDELIGYVEEIEGFLSTGIEGYSGSDNVEFQRNVHYDHYLNGKN
ncbi:TraR/DksA C4-type zinc finger protein [Bacillus sp. JCM 19034]|uniref:TraR/DksA C4-type zinc finger protein n=1 Tax=Bacillus sp. JCM 19034 TaxID=1481928 RepID=UPI0007806DB7|nr:TraR/DksA C4-type zinc finger protein [Bacillus sp. JCM 19034]